MSLDKLPELGAARVDTLASKPLSTEAWKVVPQINGTLCTCNQH